MKQSKARRTWVTDIIKFSDEPWYVARKSGDEKYDIFISSDSEFDRLVKEGGYQKADLIECWYAIRQGDAGCSFLDPFESIEAALEWIKENSESLYFVKSTARELKKRFPEIPVKMHPAEVERAFRIFESKNPDPPLNPVIPIRFTGSEKELQKKIIQEAEREKRSISGQIKHICEQYLNQRRPE